MSKLHEIYAAADIETLVKVLEHPADYTAECVQVVKDEIKHRSLDATDLKQSASELLQIKISKYLDTFSPINDKLVLPKSEILNEDEIKVIFRKCFDKFVERKELMEVDSWHYAIGAVL